MRNFLFLFAFIFWGALSADAGGEWIEQGSHLENSSVAGLVHEPIQMTSQDGGEATVELAVFPAKANLTLRLIDNPTGSADLREAAPAHGCIAGVNGGYFDPGFAPLGLRVSNGVVVRPILRARLMTGILLAKSGAIQILRTSEFSIRSKPTVAVQCGPLLVDGGRPVSGLNGNRPARRTFAAVSGERAALGVCSETSLASAAEILAALRLPDQSKVVRALNLDGGSSTAFWFKRSDGSVFSISEIKNVRDFVAIAPK